MANGQFEIEHMNPYVELIIADLQKIADDNESKFQTQLSDVLEWIEFFRDGLRECCAYHRFEDIAELQMRAHHASRHCRCNDDTNHELLKEIVDIVGKHMNKCVEAAAISRMLARRVN